MRREILQSFLRQDLAFFDRPENTVGALVSRLDSYPQAILELMGFTVSIILMSAINVLISPSPCPGSSASWACWSVCRP